MSIVSDRIRENGFIHCLLDDAADDIEELEKEKKEQEETIKRLRTALIEIMEWTEKYTSPDHPITLVAKRVLNNKA